MCIRDSHKTIIPLKQSPAAHRSHLPAERRLSTHSLQRRSAHRTGGGPAQKTNGLQIRRIYTEWTIACGVQCWRLTASLKQSRKQSTKSRKCLRLSKATCHKDRSTRLRKTYQISDWRLVLELRAGGGHFEHSHWQWNSGIWSFVNCVVSTMLLHWCSSLNIF